MSIAFLRPALVGAAIIASGGILAGGLALGPAFAVGGSANVGPFVVTHCTSNSPCQTYGNQGQGPAIEGNNTHKSAASVGVDGTATNGGTGVVGTGTSGFGVYGNSDSAYGVLGTSNSTEGVFGQSETSTAIQGESYATNGNSGVSGISNATTGSGHGIYGRSSNGEGVYGSSTSSNAVEGVSSAGGYAGIAGFQHGSDSTTGGPGVHAESADDTGVWPVIAAYGDNRFTSLFFAQNKVTGENCGISYEAVLSCTGTADFKAYRTRHLTSTGLHVLAYASESTSATLEDFGTAQMIDGVANVAIESRFATTIDRTTAYYVFLTPLGDTKGLYVSDKTPGGFQVRETQGGRSTLSFDYRIVARPLDAANDRLPVAPAVGHVR
jgi:hypothetical protein